MARAPSAASYLASRTLYGVKFGLETTRALLEALDRPERGYPTLLVAGTNGKGSVVAYADSVLRASGLRVGRYTSPHLVRVNERIVVGGSEIRDSDLEVAVSRVRRTAEDLVHRGTIPDHPTYFEAMTVAAFDHFRRARVDCAVLEVGMGGRLDATNTAEPLASAIVTIDKDHEAFLGQTLSAIAREKAGVLRQGRPTLLGALPREARRSIADVARRVGAVLVDAPRGARFSETPHGLTLETPEGVYDRLRPLQGAHQRANLLVALRLLEAASRAGLPFQPKVVSAAIAATRWPGRLHWLPGQTRTLLDGAHNPAGARALAEYVRPLRPVVLVFGAMADKDIESIVAELFPLAREIVLTRPKVPRAASPEEIQRRAGALGKRSRIEPDPRRALALARRLAGDRPVVVAGSLYLVGALLRRSRK